MSNNYIQQDTQICSSDEGLIYDWNKIGSSLIQNVIEFDDETLRDGLQCPSVTDPAIDKKIEILYLMEALGINAADIGLPGAGPRAVDDVKKLASEIVNNKLKIYPNAAARTVKADIIPIIEISNQVGVPIEVAMFIGSSPIRQYAEGWTLDHMLKATKEAVTFATDNGLPVMYVTEDTTRAHPDTVKDLYTAAIEAGAYRICIADTTGHSTPNGTRAIVNFVKSIVNNLETNTKIDWHGHRDRGLDVINSITAIEAGVHRVHGTGLGVGERAGNTPMDQLLVNLQLMGYINRDLSKLKKYCETVSAACQIPIPNNYPVFGYDAFRTATGVHAAAVIKAFRKGDFFLADLIYSGVPANIFGLEQKIEIGPMSGKSNVVYWLEKHGIDPTDELIDRIFSKAKQSKHILTSEEVHSICKEYMRPKISRASGELG